MSIPSARDDWDSLCSRYYQSINRFEPSPLIDMVWQEGMDLFPLLEEDALRAQLVLREMMLSSIEEFPASELDRKRLFERNFLFNRISDQIAQRLQNRDHYSDPFIYLPYSSLLQLLAFPPENFADIFTRTIKSVPGVLRVAKVYLGESQGIVDIWLLAAIETIKKNEAWLLNLPGNQVVEQYIGKPERLQPDIEKAIQALRDFVLFLQNDAQERVKNTALLSADQFKRNVQNLYCLDNEIKGFDEAASFSLLSDDVILADRSGDSATRYDILAEVMAFFLPESNPISDVVQRYFNSPGDLLKQMLYQDNELRARYDLEQQTMSALPLKETEQLLWYRVESDTLAYRLLSNSALGNTESWKVLNEYMRLMSWIDASVHLGRASFSQLIAKLKENSHLSDDVIEVLVFMVSRYPGAYYALYEKSRKTG